MDIMSNIRLGFTMNDLSEFEVLRHRAGLSVSDVAEITGKHQRTIRRYEKDSTLAPPQLVLDKLLDRIRSRSESFQQQNASPEFKFIDLFAGIGGLRRPFDELNGQCVFTSEWDRFARETYGANFSDDVEHISVGDIRPYSEKPDQIPSHDLLLAGFPCQPFSLAGVSKKNALGRPHGFLCDTQGTLFYDVAKIIKHHQPAAFLLENVKNLKSHDGKRTFSTIMNVLENELKYKVTHRVISSEHWVPQKRERIFIVGFRDPDIDFDINDMSLPNGEGPKLGSILDDNVPEKYTLTPNLWKYLQAYKAKHAKAGNGFGCSVFGPDDVSRTLSARYYKDGSEVLIHQDNNRPRRLTPRECARLMGFEKRGDNQPFQIPVSDTQAYRQFGNSVVVPVVKAVAEHMRPYLLKAVHNNTSNTITDL